MICSILDVARGNCLTSLDAVPVASVWLYYTGISLRDCGVCEEACLLGPWWRPGAKCVCCRRESAASTTHSLSQTVGCGCLNKTTVHLYNQMWEFTLLLKFWRFRERIRLMLSISSGKRGRLWERGSTLIVKCGYYCREDMFRQLSVAWLGF